MRIAYIIADRHIPVFGQKGASIHAQEMINAFVALGHDVNVYAANIGPQDATQDATIDARFIPIDCEATVADTTSLDARRKREFKEQQAMSLATRIRDAVVRDAVCQPFDFVYERYSLFSSAGVDSAEQLGIPALIEVNSPLVDEQLAFRQLVNLDAARAVEHSVFRKATSIIAVSDQVRDYVHEVVGCASERSRPTVHVVPNGVDIARFHPLVQPAMPLADDVITVGFAGSLKPWHGIDVLLRAFRQLIASGVAVRMLIVGDGPLGNWINGFIEGAGLADHVTLTGWVENKKLPHYIKAMDIAVAPYPASDNFYFSPLKLFEYLAVGVPVVASRIGQVEDVVRGESIGVMCEPGDVDDLAKKIRGLVEDGALRAEFGRNAVATAATRTWRGNAARVVDIAMPVIRAA